ncbi:MAG: MFS transporter, partial [Candidatus Obscuribacterales bacterium]|nr:MFS transporter [Candidatus Obscuribacterales bacterium]
MQRVWLPENDKSMDANKTEEAAAKKADFVRPPGFTNYRWVVVALSAIIIIINYMDRTAISYAVGPLKQEFGLDNIKFGMIGSAFAIGYTIMTLGGGIIVDLWGARKCWTGAAVAWSICTGLLAVCTGFGHLVFLRIMLGITEGPCFPAMTRAVTDWLPMTERGRSSAICLAAVPLASVLGAPLISHLIVNLGWRMMFVVLGALGIVWSVFWWVMFRDYPQNSKHVSAEELHHIHEGQVPHVHGSDEEIRKHTLSNGKTTWKFILFNPSLMANNYSFFSFGYLLFFATIWLPGFLEQTYHLKVKEIGLYLVVPWLTAALFVTGAGILSDHLYRTTHNIRTSRTHIIWVSQMLSAVCFIALTQIHSLEMVIVFMSLGLAFGLAPNASFYSLNSDLAKDRAATSLGLMDCFLAFAGLIAPTVTGWLSETTGNFNSGIILMAGLIFTSALTVFFFQHPDRDIAKAEA